MNSRFYASIFSLALIPYFTFAAESATRYENHYFGFSLSLPPSWKIVPEATPHEFQKLGGEALIRDRVLPRDVVAADQANTQSVLKLIPVEQPPRFIPSFTITAEGLPPDGPITTARDYTLHTGKLLTSLKTANSQILDPASKVTVDRHEMYRSEYVMMMPVLFVHTVTYTIVARQKALLFILTADKDGMRELTKIFETLRFDIAQ